MKKILIAIFQVGLLVFTVSSCDNVLEPEPVDLLVNDIVLNEPNDVPNVEIGLYSAFRSVIPSTVISGDFTADMLLHNGTFSQYRELGTKQISSANASANTLWGSIYNTVYLANFILERLPQIAGVKTADRNRVLGAAHFLRGYAYFIGLYTFGPLPKVTSTSIEANRNIPKATEEELFQLIEDDYLEAIDLLPREAVNAGFAGRSAVQSALARLRLYQENWEEAEFYANEVINSGQYALDSLYQDIVNTDFPQESIFEVGYTIADDPGTSTSIGLNNLFVGRREIIPSNQTMRALFLPESGERFYSASFDSRNLEGSDNGWSVAKYGTADADNNNVVVFRLAEMYLIRAEARAKRGNVTDARQDINALRQRADEFDFTKKQKVYNIPLVPASITQDQLLRIIEQERVLELAFEGHRWYDLKRTGRLATVMPAFSGNWKNTYDRWPIPQREIQNNPALVGQQNPGY